MKTDSIAQQCSGRVRRLYLDELEAVDTLLLMLGLVRLIVTPEPQAVGIAQQYSNIKSFVR